MFNDLDNKMRHYETYRDQLILPGVQAIVRLDGRNFTGMTRNPKYNFETPFDVKFNKLMVDTVDYIMRESGFNIIYGYTQSDEISLMLHVGDTTFNRKVRKILSGLSSMASAYFTLNFGNIATFDARVSELITTENVEDYFRWRQLDATRNALNSWCYWTLRKNGDSVSAATSALSGKTVSEKNEILFAYGINFKDLPAWQKRGVGLYWKEVDHEGYNPITKEKIMTVRRRVLHNNELPFPEEYIQEIIKPIIAGQYS